MAPSSAQRLQHQLQQMVEGSGIVLNGPNPWDPQIKDDRFYARILSEGALGLGESYMDGWWECQRIDEMICRLLRSNVASRFRWNIPEIVGILFANVVNRQSKRRAFMIGKEHYDAGNDLYMAMLDKRMVYTCGYWNPLTGAVTTLDEAQEAKLDLVCRKIGLKPGQRVLDIGCGWGSFAKFAAEKYGAHVVGVTVSEEQLKLAQENCAGLPVEIRLQDYRDVNEQFDHIISLDMFEHVGVKNYRTYFEMVNRCLKEDGLFLLHTIGWNHTKEYSDPWIDKYIFPNSMLPSPTHLAKASEGLFVMEDWHNFGADYHTTLQAWSQNVEARWSTLEGKYDERFHRMWHYYLQMFSGAFLSRTNQLWQVVYSKKGVAGGYRSVR